VYILLVGAGAVAIIEEQPPVQVDLAVVVPESLELESLEYQEVLIPGAVAAALLLSLLETLRAMAEQEDLE